MSRFWMAVSVSALLLATAAARPLAAQRIEIATRVGYSPPTGTLFQLGSGSSALRAWDGGGPSVGATAAYWLTAHFGVEGTADARFVGHYADPGVCAPGIPCNLREGPVDTRATQLLASLRFAARQRLGERFRVGASLGPAIVRFGDSEYRACSLNPPGVCGLYYFAHRLVYGFALGVSAAYALSPRFLLSVGADDAMYRVQPAAALSAGFGAELVTPLQHQLTFSVVTSILVQ
jgi:hypothetical protein